LLRHSTSGILGIILFSAFAAVSLGSVCRADSIKLDANAAFKSEYNDNLYLHEEGDEVDDLINTLSPGLKMRFTGDSFSSELNGRADILKYNENDDLDTVDDEFRAAFNYRLSQRLSLKTDGRYQNISRPDYYVEETGLTIAKEIERCNGSIKAEYQLTEKTFSSIEYAHDNLEYRDESKPGTETNSGTLVIGSSLDSFSNTIGRLTLGYSRSLFQGLQLDSMTAFAGFTRSINEKWSVSFDAGINEIQTDFGYYRYVPVTYESGYIIVPVRVSESDDYLEWMAFSGLDYKGELSTIRFSLSRVISPAPERTGAVERLSAGLNVMRRITEDFSLDASAVYYTNKSDSGQFSVSETDEETVQIRPGMKYRINRYIDFEAAWKLTMYKNRSSGSDKDAMQNVVYCRFFAGYPVFE
jgi:hypothetical protein